MERCPITPKLAKNVSPLSSIATTRQFVTIFSPFRARTGSRAWPIHSPERFKGVSPPIHNEPCNGMARLPELRGTLRRAVRERTMIVRYAILILVLIAFPKALFAGPPFQTGHPEPIDCRNFEFYT